MRVALICYPMIFQNRGGVANKIRSTLAALREKGVDARLFDINTDLIREFDLIHVFCTGSGNQRIVEAANDLGIPVVLSSVFSLPYGRFEGWRNRLLHKLICRLSRYSLNTTWGQVNRAFRGSARIIVLGAAEAKAITENFDVDPSVIRTIPNGIGEAFFNADRSVFLSSWTGCRPIVLMSGNISPAKNQLAAVRAVRDLEADLILFGSAGESQKSYLDTCLSEGRDKVHYLGSRALDDPYYASAYAAAAVTVLPSRTEVTPNVILESLAARTPAVCTIHNAWDRPFPSNCYIEIDPEDVAGLRRSIAHFIEHPPDRGACRAAVDHLRWPTVAERVIDVYGEVFPGGGAAAGNPDGTPER